MLPIMKVVALISICLGMVAGQAFKIENDADTNLHSDCHSLYKAGYNKNGTYKLHVEGEDFLVPCEFRAGFGFSIILYRVDGAVSWERSFHDYEYGFGYPIHDYFSGLRLIHYFTKNGNNVLDSTFVDWDNHFKYAINEGFSVGDKDSGYQLSITGKFQGSVPDDMSYSSGNKFYTLDNRDPHHCVDQQRGGWWYYYCTKALPTGHFYDHGHYTTNKTLGDGIYWADYKGPTYSLKRFAMALRPSS